MTLKLSLSPKPLHAAAKRHGFLCFLGLDKAWAMDSSAPQGYKHGKQAGFSLLELLIVIGLLGLVAMSTTTLIINTGENERQAETERRWNEIRKAIIGDPNLSLNGSPYISGYVADMGRLPSSVRELVDQTATYDHDNNIATAEIIEPYDHDNNPATPDITINQPAWTTTALSTVTAGMTGQLSSGWRGPYLYTAGSQFFRDGWANVNTAIADNDAINYGWDVTHTPAVNPHCSTVPDCTVMTVTSLGDNNAAEGSGFNEDFPAAGINIVNSAEWQLNGAISFAVVFNSPPGANQGGLELRVYFVEGGAITEEVSTTQFSLLTTNPYPHTEMLTISGPLPMGKIAVAVWCASGTVYDGDCVAGNTKLPYYMSLLPNATLPITIPWNTP